MLLLLYTETDKSELLSYLIFAPTIMCKIARSSSFEIKSSLSKSYILKATENNKKLTIY